MPHQLPPRPATIHPVGPPRVIQGSFPGGQPRIPAVAQPRMPGHAVQLPPTVRLGPPVGGRPLPPVVQRKMEEFFRANFSDVRVHVGSEAASIGALAFTCGSNVYFGPGQYNPAIPAGLRLIAHELTHVVQQRAGKVRNPFGAGVAVVHDPVLEREAEMRGAQVAQMREAGPPAPPVPRPASVRPVVQRAEEKHHPGRPFSRDSGPYDIREKFGKQTVRWDQFTRVRQSPFSEDGFAGVVKGHLSTATEANDVIFQLYVDGRRVDAEDPPGNYIELFKLTGVEGMDVFHSNSHSDGEIRPLASALETFKNWLEARTRRTNHHLVLIGPCGACDSCKERIKLFKQIWHNLAKQEGLGTAFLFVTYIYKDSPVISKKIFKPVTEDEPSKSSKKMSHKDLKKKSKEKPKPISLGSISYRYGWEEAEDIVIDDESYKFRQYQKRASHVDNTGHKHPSPYLRQFRG
ncbi:MAG TPA: DUF4157 domain-containing protein [Thermoanaerobaculia bacterium]